MIQNSRRARYTGALNNEHKTQKIYNRLKNEVNELLVLPFFERGDTIDGVLTPPGLEDRALALLAMISA